MERLDVGSQPHLEGIQMDSVVDQWFPTLEAQVVMDLKSQRPSTIICAGQGFGEI